MASSQSVAAAEMIIANHAFFFIEDSALFAEATLIFHEYLITIDSEVRLIWRRKITGATVLFFLNRYIMVFRNAITIASYPSIGNTFSLVAPAHAAFSTLRVYALSGRDWRIAAVVCFIMLGPIIANVYDLPQEKPVNLPPPYNCEVANSVATATDTKRKYPSSVYNVVVIASRVSLIVGDAIVLAVTWWKTYRIKKAADAAQMRTSIVDLILRDGTIYFATMLLLNVLHIVINFVETVSFMGDIANTLTSILISRFIMNLRDIDGKDTGQNSAWTGAASEIGTWRAVPGQGGHQQSSDARGTIMFASHVAESMGGDLVHSMRISTDSDSQFSCDTPDGGQTGSAIEEKVMAEDTSVTV
ncbi:hypothetical protein C2E23DRAFT_887374 [Lenzites betulinus]|nr:hypothetical protein C2E23DRAFT_887374 [Lenzites betulinus]